ncbi:hypothetical protein CDV31_011383 [Fusarium ambrosium]|uniref:Up-regulated during septation protein 1 domain-containing protein n=1 Tax=Fusarium ambrosium TaxID=131363 RepID=A0A428TH52_9HYPO|nr:hypothetical protein CDV31_011383 [Fusarium ambrosium]
MAHIAKCIVDIDASHITKPTSQPANELKTSPQPEKPFTWRMQQPDPPRKYQLFPKERRLPILNSGKNAESEKGAPAAAGTSASTNEKAEKQSVPNSFKKRLNQASLVRRRKISVPEVGPMTTVQELSMDSPTIPGRPPFHERSISAPGNSSRKHQLMDTFLYISSDDEGPDPREEKESRHPMPQGSIPISPKHLAPLVIPKSDAQLPILRRQQSLNCFPSRSDSLRTGRNNVSPRSRTPFTPASSMPDLSTPRSAVSTNAASTGALPTPVSAPITESRPASPKPAEGRFTPTLTAEPTSVFRGHRRGGSESSSMTDRGRPRKRPDLRTNNGPIIQRTESKRSKSSEKKAFEKLPTGVKQADATQQLEQSELALLQKQAFAQVGRFEVLKSTDVEALSKELRHLDERTEYLRRTYNALRVGRRNLHSRICQYLRSPRVAKFSHDSMLKQEEALAELDASIDDWVNKLEQAENRRTRVRQKLLEHLAAAACLPVGGLPMTPEPQQQQAPSSTPSSGVGNISTPPRSPSKETFTSPQSTSSPHNSPSPQRFVSQVPSTILEQPVIEEAENQEEEVEERPTSMASLKRSDVESIRIYAGDDVYALLADVENEITLMSKQVSEPPSAVDMMETKRIALHRQRSHEMLNGLSIDNHHMKRRDISEPRAVSPLASPPTTRESEPVEDDIPLLANTVYKP